MPPATPASIALPPASRMRKPASAARYWHAATMWRVPMMVGRWAFMLSSVGSGAARRGPCRRISILGNRKDYERLRRPRQLQRELLPPISDNGAPGVSGWKDQRHARKAAQDDRDRPRAAGWRRARRLRVWCRDGAARPDGRRRAARAAERAQGGDRRVDRRGQRGLHRRRAGRRRREPPHQRAVGRPGAAVARLLAARGAARPLAVRPAGFIRRGRTCGRFRPGPTITTPIRWSRRSPVTSISTRSTPIRRSWW